jgi:hypothetical protein
VIPAGRYKKPHFSLRISTFFSAPHENGVRLKTAFASLFDSSLWGVVSLKRYMRSHRRGAVLILAVVVSLVISFIVMAVAWSAQTQTKMTADLSKTDQAFCAAEAGIHRVAWYLRNAYITRTAYHNSSGTALLSPFNTPFSGTIGGYSYTASCALVSSSDLRIVVTSTATNGNFMYTMSAYVSPPAQGVPTFATAGDWDNKNTDVIGDVQTQGAFTNNGGSGSVKGNIFYGDPSSTGTDAATGVARYVDPNTSSDPNSFNEMDWLTLANRLNGVVAAEGPSAVLWGSQSSKTFDFTKLPGTNAVYMVIGNVTDPDFKGSGTLYVVGSIEFTKNRTLGDTSNTINLVSLGAVNNITFDKKITIYGSLYAQGDWNRAQTDVYGMVYVQGVVRSNNGSSTLDATGITVPFFDTRAPTGSAVTSPMVINHFTGPLP